MLAHGEDGRPVAVVEFDYDIVDRDLFGERAPEEFRRLSKEDVERGCAVLRVLLQWVWQNGMKQPLGILLRAIIVCWVFLPELRPLELSQLARGFGKKKQSLGRWVDNFKVCFPAIKTPHMRPPRLRRERANERN